MTYRSRARTTADHGTPRGSGGARQSLAAGGDSPSNPLYKEVKNRLMRGLVAGQWKPGEAIPSEWQLAEHYDVSVGTIRRAVDELVAEKIVQRRQGSGTFVTTHTEDHQLYYFFHIVGKGNGKEPPTHELVSFRRAAADAEIASRLRLGRGERVFRIHNVLKLAGRPVVFDEITLPENRFPDLTKALFAGRSGTIYGLYQARYGIHVIRITERLSAARASAQQAVGLEIGKGDPALIIKRVAYTYHDSPVEYRVSCVNTGQHEYLSDLWKSAPPGASTP
jgi:GntR family transcriptional regulator